MRFQKLVTSVDMLIGLFGPGEATLNYDLHTATPAGTRRTAEHLTLGHGAISSIVLIWSDPLLKQDGPLGQDDEPKAFSGSIVARMCPRRTTRG